MTDAESTLRFAIRGALVDTAHLTGLRAGNASEALVEAVATAIFAPSMVWAVDEIRRAALAGQQEGE